MKKIFALVAAAAFAVLGVYSYSQAYADNNTQTSVPTATGDKYRSFVKTSARCGKCSCTGYWGYRHNNGTYEGSCQNSDGHGHTCGHSPQNHGLRAW